jgi:hypothetical protein
MSLPPVVVIQVKGVPRELWAQVSALSTMQARDKSQVVISALEEYIKNHK